MKFHFALSCVLCAHALAQYENNMELKATATPVAPSWNTAVLYTTLKSALFGTCITAANTNKMQYYLINSPEQGIEFVKYELYKFEKSLTSVNWTKEIQCKDIVDCAKASKDYLMFQYSGTTCRIANVTYVNRVGWFFWDYEGYTNDTVYINPTVYPAGTCPATTEVIETGTGPKCVGGTNQKVPFPSWNGWVACDLYYAGHLYAETDSLNFTTLRNFMRKKNYQGEFMVNINHDRVTQQGYRWDDIKPVDTSYFAVVPQEPFYQGIVVISSSHDYLLVALNDTSPITGFLCIRNSVL